MAQNEINVRLITRHDTEENWTTKNPILLAGELSINDNNNLIKIGDGVNAWQDLDYINDVSPNDITFAKDFIVTSDVGEIIIPEGQTNVNLSAKGKTLEEVLESILTKVENPIVKNPEVTLTMTTPTKVEVGTQITPAYSASLSTGSYSYGPETGITATSWVVTDNATTPHTLTTATGTFPAVTISDTTRYEITATATYDNGAIPLNNIGENYPEGQIKAGSVTSSVSVILSGYRNYYYGTLATSTEEAPLTSALIRSLTAGGAYDAEKTHTIVATNTESAKRIVIAYPENAITEERKGLVAANISSSFNYDAFNNGNYVRQANVEVEGVNGAFAIPYIVWVYEPAELDPSEIHVITLA